MAEVSFKNIHDIFLFRINMDEVSFKNIHDIFLFRINMK